MTSYRVTLYEKLIKKSFESVKLLNPNSDFEGEKSDPSNTVFVPCRLAERAHSKNKNGRIIIFVPIGIRCIFKFM